MSKPGEHRHKLTSTDHSDMPVRLDRWLWAARFFKTRSLAKSAIEGGKVTLQGQRVKPAKEISVGQQLTIRRGLTEQVVDIIALSDKRGPAKVASTLYCETPESVERRAGQSAQRRMERAGLQVPSHRPSKKDRREIRKLKTQQDTRNNNQGSMQTRNTNDPS